MWKRTFSIPLSLLLSILFAVGVPVVPVIPLYTCFRRPATDLISLAPGGTHGDKNLEFPPKRLAWWVDFHATRIRISSFSYSLCPYRSSLFFFSFHFWTPVVCDLLPSYYRLLYLLASLDKYFILISPAAAGPASSYTLRLFWSLAALSCIAVCCNCTATPLSDAATSTDFTRFSLDYHDCKAGPRSSFESPCSLPSNPLDREKQGAARSQSCRASNPRE